MKLVTTCLVVHTGQIPCKRYCKLGHQTAPNMTYLNEWSLIQRLNDLYNRDFNTVSKLFRDRSKDMKLVRNVRNYLTHYEGSKVKMAKYVVSREFIMLTLKLKLFVAICLLRSMRMRQTRIRQIMRQLNEFQWLSTEDHGP